MRKAVSSSILGSTKAGPTKQTQLPRHAGSTPSRVNTTGGTFHDRSVPSGIDTISMESLILAQDERWRRA